MWVPHCMYNKWSVHWIFLFYLTVGHKIQIFWCNNIEGKMLLMQNISTENLCAVKTRLCMCGCMHEHVSTVHSIDVSLCLTFLSGRLNRNSRSKRPGLLSAGSIESSLFVAPMTTISPRLSKPSIKASRVDTIELDREKEVGGTECNTCYLVSGCI